MTWRVILGTLSMVLTVILLGFVAVTEQSRMDDFQTSYKARQIEVGAALFEGRCVTCHNMDGKGIEGVAPALNAADLLSPKPQRLKDIGWAGTTEDYIRSAIASGRPRASNAFSTFPTRMPTWGEEFGGPLRKDQINALVLFIMNWSYQYTSAEAQPTPVIEGVGTDITLELPAGNADNGKALTEGKGCTACHITAAVGPAWLATADPNKEGVGTRVGHRFSDAGYTGKAKTAEQYLFESIVNPNAYVVTGFAPSIMTQTFGNSLTKQDVADIIAYLETLK